MIGFKIFLIVSHHKTTVFVNNLTMTVVYDGVMQLEQKLKVQVLSISLSIKGMKDPVIKMCN